jgi:hypothetical protein
MGLDTLSLTLLAALLLTWGLWWFLRRNDELPLVIAAFNAIFVERLVAVEGGIADWVGLDFDGAFSFFGYPHVAATYMLLGAVLMVGAYCMKYSPPRFQVDDAGSLRNFIESQRKVIFVLFGAFVVINVLIGLSYEEAPEVITEQSYAYLFTLGYSAFIILITAYLLHTARASLLQKTLLIGVIAIVAFYTLAPSLRFAVLGWIVALAIILTGKYPPFVRLVALAGCGLAIGVGFAALGALRQDQEFTSFGEIVEQGVMNLGAGSDVNMVDGFVMLMQVYPDVLEYGLGTEHLEIFARPIPRAIWPDKPPGGWTQKVAAATGRPFFTTGISASLYGSFYGEGGVLGIMFFALLYGWLFAKYVNWANRFGSDLRWVLRGVFIASLFPLMRGGDIPGIVAFIGMSYWPLVLFVWRYRQGLRTQAGMRGLAAGAVATQR